MQCKYCCEHLTSENTSCASEAYGMCQNCFTEMIENLGWGQDAIQN